MKNVIDCVVVGKGRAGRARVRVIEEHPYFSLLEHISGRSFVATERIEGDLFFICTENTHHFSIAKKLLTNGKDVVLEFPPCTTQREWQILYALSQEKETKQH